MHTERDLLKDAASLRQKENFFDLMLGVDSGIRPSPRFCMDAGIMWVAGRS
jgi:hypothetical protein